MDWLVIGLIGLFFGGIPGGLMAIGGYALLIMLLAIIFD